MIRSERNLGALAGRDLWISVKDSLRGDIKLKVCAKKFEEVCFFSLISFLSFLPNNITNLMQFNWFLQQFNHHCQYIAVKKLPWRPHWQQICEFQGCLLPEWNIFADSKRAKPRPNK